MSPQNYHRDDTAVFQTLFKGNAPLFLNFFGMLYVLFCTSSNSQAGSPVKFIFFRVIGVIFERQVSRLHSLPENHLKFNFEVAFFSFVVYCVKEEVVDTH